MRHVSESIKNHIFIRIILRIRNTLFKNNEDEFKDGFNSCLGLIIEHFNHFPHRVLDENQELKNKIHALNIELRASYNERINYHEVKRYRNDIALNILGLLNKNKTDEAIEILNRWCNTKTKIIEF